jgi:hypothetical protein
VRVADLIMGLSSLSALKREDRQSYLLEVLRSAKTLHTFIALLRYPHLTKDARYRLLLFGKTLVNTGAPPPA